MPSEHRICICALILFAASLAGAADKSGARYEIAVTRGMESLNRGRYREAAASFSRAMALKPGDPEARYYLAVTDTRRGKYRSAATLLGTILSEAEDYRDARLYLGISLFGQEKWSDALEQIREFDARSPGSAAARYYMGQCRRMLKDYDAALDDLAAARNIDPAYTGLCRYYEGLVYLEQGRKEEAAIAFDDVVSSEPQGTELRRAAREELSRLLKPWALRRTRFSLSTGYEYDSNVTLLPDDPGIVATSDKGDWRYYVNPRVEFTPVNAERFQLSTLYDFYNSTHNHLGAFNLQGHRLLTSAFGKTRYVWPYVRYDFGYYFLRDVHQDYLRSLGLVAGALLLETPRMVTDVSYGRYDDTYFIREFTPENDRDARNNAIGFDHFIYLDPPRSRYLRLGFRYDRNGAEGRNFSYNGYRFDAEYSALFRHGLGMDLLAEYYPRFFWENVVNRRDHRFLVSAEISKALSEEIRVAFRYDLLINDSTVPLYEYKKDVFSMGIYLEI